MKKNIQKLNKPRGAWLVISYIFTLVFIGAAMTMLLFDFQSDVALSILAYVSFALAALSLAYSVYTIVIYAPGLKGKILSYLRSREITHRLLENWGFRTIVTSLVSFLMSIFSSVVNAYLGIATGSIWFGALAAYYIFLTLMRSRLLLYHRNIKEFESEGLMRAKKYRSCGILLLILNAALSSAIAQMIFDDRRFEYKDWLIYAFAAYAFYKISMAIVNLVRARRQDDLTIQAIRELNVVDAAVSILALQTALLHTFSTGDIDISLFNTLTGSAVSVFALSLSIYMIIKGNQTVKEIKRQNAK